MWIVGSPETWELGSSFFDSCCIFCFLLSHHLVHMLSDSFEFRRCRSQVSYGGVSDLVDKELCLLTESRLEGRRKVEKDAGLLL